MAAQRKPVPTAAPKKPAPETEDLQILKKGTCPTVSGKSSLRYEIGSDAKNSLHVRVTEASGGGFWSREWVALTDIRSALEKASPITAILLFPLFRGKSVNTPGYLLGVLIAEKLIRPLPNKTRVHELCEDFDVRVAKLSASDESASTGKSASKSPAKSKPTSKPSPAKSKKKA